MSRRNNTYFSDYEESYLKSDEETEAERTRRNANKRNTKSRFNAELCRQAEVQTIRELNIEKCG
jgi:hypothetical protein